MNPEEQNGIIDNLNFLHSDCPTYYNQEKLGSENIHASDVQHPDNVMSTMDNYHASGSTTTKLSDFEMENPHETDSSQYVNDEPGCVPIANEPVQQTAPPQATVAPTQPMTHHPVAAPVMVPSGNIVHVGPGTFASTVQVPAQIQLNVSTVYTRRIIGAPPVGQFLVQRWGKTNNLVIIPPPGVMFKTVDAPIVTEQQAIQVPAMTIQQTPHMESSKQGQRRTLSTMATAAPEPKKARIVENMQSGPAGPMNSQGHKNNPTIAPVAVSTPMDLAKRFDPARYQPVTAQANNFQEEEDEATEDIPQILGPNVSEPNSQWGANEPIEMFELQPMPELEYEQRCCDKTDHNDIHDQYLIPEEQTPTLSQNEILDTIHDLGDSHRQDKVPVHKPTRISDMDSNNDSKSDEKKEEAKCKISYWSMGCAIGLGNVWRFPYLCYKYGGGSFMVAYLFFLVLVSVPMLKIEVTMGQFMSRGGIELWNMVPISKAIGFATLLVVVYINIYNIVILAWTFFYFCKSVVANFTGHLPWTSCDFKGASACCSNEYNRSTLVAPQGCESDPIYPEAEYFSNNVLNITSGINEIGGMNWTLFGFLILALGIVFSMVYKGVKSTGKAAYVTSTFSLVILMALVIRGVTLDGAMEGFKYFITPDLNKLVQADTWLAAASQIMFSYSLCQGPLTGSYNKWSFNSIKWTVKLSFLNSVASMFAGIAIFLILGHLSTQTGIPIEKVADKGPGLAFIAYSRALSTLPGSAIWNTVFFLMLIMLGIASQCAQVEGMITTMVDLKQNFFKAANTIRRQLFVALACFISFLFALPMVLNSGMYYFQLMDSYGASGMAHMIITILEVVSFAWIIGVDNDDLEQICYESRALDGKHNKSDPKKQRWRSFRYIRKFITLSYLRLLLSCLIDSFVTFEGPSYDSLVTGHYEYPTIGWMNKLINKCNGLVCSTVCCVPIYALMSLCKVHSKAAESDSRSENIVKNACTVDGFVKSSDDNTNIHKQTLNSNSLPDLTSSYDNVQRVQ